MQGGGKTYEVSGETTEWEDILINKGITTKEEVLISKGLNPFDVRQFYLHLISFPLTFWNSISNKKRLPQKRNHRMLTKT